MSETGDSMIHVIFVCYGNICRSPLGEFVFKDMVAKAGLQDRVRVASAGTHVLWEGEGEPVSYGSKQELKRHGIPFTERVSTQLREADLLNYEYIIPMDQNNLESILDMAPIQEGCTVRKLMDFATGGDVADPYYTHDYGKAYEDIELGCRGLLEDIRARLEQ